MDSIKTYINENHERFINELLNYLRIPSISAIGDHKPDMYRAASFLKDELLSSGVDTCEIFETTGNPVLVAEKIIDVNKPTILIYAHMDVMPVDPIDKWFSNPFEPEIRDGHIFARGANDDKGQSFMHFKAFEYLVKTNQLPCNVKFLIESEEEIGSPSLAAFCAQNKEMLKADVILVSDTGMIAANIPSITTGLRGLAYWQVEVTGPNRDLHSGLFGGAVANPVTMLSKMIASLTDSEGKITIPGFYDQVLEVSETERKLLAKAPFDVEKYKNALEISGITGEMGFSTPERTGIRPAIDVCGIWGGYTGEGTKTVIPSKAFAKISARLVPNQDYQLISDQFKAYFESIAPLGTQVKVTSLHGGQAYVCPIDHAGYVAASKAIEKVYGKEAVPYRSGGSIPIVTEFEKILGIKTILLGFGLESDAIHSPNENFSLDRFRKGIETIVWFYHYYCQ